MTFSKIVHWFAISSADPSAISLSLKGLLMTGIPIVVTLTGIAHVQLDSTTLTTAADAVVAFVNAVFVAIGLGIAAYGFVRKVVLTLTGNNAVAKALVSAP